MDNFREWLSDNLRYFLLGFAILAVVIIAAIGIRIYQRVEGSAQKPTDNVRVESETSSAAGETAKGTEKTSETEKQSEGGLLQTPEGQGPGRHLPPLLP